MIKTILLGILVAVFTLIYEVLVVLYTQKIAKKKMYKAAILSVAIELISIFFIWVVVNNFYSILFGVIGAFFGPLYANKIEKKVKKLKLFRFVL